jgi:cbb3-type cytochrome oxidase cytochrome c subunit
MATDKQEQTRNLTYDDRRKILIQKKTQVQSHKVPEVKNEEGSVTEKEKLLSTVDQSMTVEYTEEGIKLAYKNLAEEKSYLDKRTADMKKKQEELKEMPKELVAIKKQLEELQKYQKHEKETEEYDATIERMKEVKKELDELKEAIGTRLKL